MKYNVPPLIHSSKKTWGEDQIILETHIDNEYSNKIIYEGSDKIRDFVKKIHQAFFDGFEVRISILPVDTKKEYVGSIDNEYDHDRGSM